MKKLPYLEWKSEYGLGDSVIDAQHQYLFTLANEIFHADTQSEVQRSLLQLFRYVREHFQDEEALMERRGYDGIAWHRERHNELISQLDMIASNGNELPVEQWIQNIQAFMVDWLLTHILEVDAKIPKRENRVIH